MLGFLLIGAFALIAFSAWRLTKNSDDDVAGVGAGISGVAALALSLMFIFAAADYLDNIGYVAQADRLIAVRSEELAKLDAQIESAMKAAPDSIHMNADTPVASIVAARLKVADRLVRIREKKIHTEISISISENGLWWPLMRMIK